MRFGRLTCTKSSIDSLELGRNRLLSTRSGRASNQQALRPGKLCKFWQTGFALRPSVVPALLLLATPASAQPARYKNIELCNAGSQVAADSVITGCTALIDAGAETTMTLAIVYSNRGNAFIQKGEYDNAIRDYDQSIKSDPE